MSKPSEVQLNKNTKVEMTYFLVIYIFFLIGIASYISLRLTSIFTKFLFFFSIFNGLFYT